MNNALKNLNEYYENPEVSQLMIDEYAERLKKWEDSNEFLLEDNVFSQQVKSSLHHQFITAIYLQYISFYTRNLKAYDESSAQLFIKLEELQKETLSTLRQVTEELTKES